MPKKTKLIILALVILIGLCIFRDFCIKSIIGAVASNVTGAPVSIGGLSLSILRQSVKISNLKIYNPQGFEKDILADIPRAGVALNAMALFKGKIHLRELELDIKELGMIKNKEGRLNVDSLKVAEEKAAPAKPAKKPAKPLAIQIDIAKFGIGRVVSKDYSVAGEPAIKVYDINLEKTYKNITSAEQLVVLIITEPLKSAGISGLKMYGATLLTGVAALPLAAAFTFTGKDFVKEDIRGSFDKIYTAGLKAIQAAGRVRKEDKDAGVISAEVEGSSVTLKLKPASAGLIEVTVSARKFGLPQPSVASGIMYRLKEELKK